MATSEQLPNNPTPISTSTANTPTMSPRLHTDFIEIQAHTAKCDLCERHNKLTLYRCTECGQQTCSVCWNKQSGDETHLFNSGLAGGPDLNAYPAVDDNGTGGERDDQGRTRTRRRGRVITDDEDADALISKPARVRENAEASGASKHQGKRNKVNMSTNHHENHESGLPPMWPMVPAKRLAVLRPAVPAASANAYESANRDTQRNSYLQGQKLGLDQQRMAQAYDGPERQTAPTRYVLVDGQQTTPQVRHQNLPNGPHQQTTHPAYLHAQPAVHRPRPEADVDQQAARNQYAFANNRPTNRQVPRPAQPRVAQQQPTQAAPPYRPRPGVNVDRQAARNELAFAPRPHTNHQAPRPAQASISQQHAQNAAHMAQILAARNQEAYRLNQQAQEYVNAEQMEARNRQVLISHQSTRPVVNSQVAARNQQVSNLNRPSPASADHVVQMLAARDRQEAYEAYLSRQQADQSSPPKSGPAQSSASHGSPLPLSAQAFGSPSPRSAQAFESPSPLPAQDFVSAQHTARPATRQFQHRVTIQDLLNGPSEDVQARKRSPEVIKAADVPLSHAEVEQVPGNRSHSDQNANGVSQLLNAAGQPDRAGSAYSESRSSPKILVVESEAAGTKPTSPHGSPLSADADPAKARIDKHRARLAELHSPSGTPNGISDLAVSPRGHENYGLASLQPDSEPVRAGSSAAQSHGSAPGDGQSYPGPKLPISDHALTYLNQWNSGRAALSSRSRSSTADGPPNQLRSPVTALHLPSNIGVQDTVAAGPKEGEAAEVSSPALRSPMSVTEGPSGVDAVMIDLDAEILEDEKSRRSKAWAFSNNPWTTGMAKGAEKARARAPEPIPGLHSDGRAEKHQRGEKEGDSIPSKEQKVSDDIDVVDARGRHGKENHPVQIDDDDGSDIEITSWNNLDGNKTTGKHQGTKAGPPKGPESSRTLKKGVAQAKKPERKGRKGKTTAARVG